MSKVTKIFVGLLLLVTVLFGLASVILPHYIDPNRYRQTIETKVQELTGRKLTIGGNIEWSIFPSLGLTLHQVELADKPEYQQPVLAKMNSVSINVDLLPLLSKKLQIGRIALNNLELHVVRNLGGETNVLTLTEPTQQASLANAQKAEATTAAVAAESKKPTENASGLQFNVDIQTINVKDSLVSFKDLSSKLDITLKDVQFHSKGVSETAEFPFHLSFTANSANPSLDGRVDINSLVQLNTMLRDYTLRDVDGNITLKGETLFTSGAPLHVRAKKIHLNHIKEIALDLEKFVAEFDGMKISSDLSSPFDLSEVRPSGTITIDEFNLRKIVGDIAPAALPMLPAGLAQKVSFNMNIASDSTKTTFSDIQATLDDSVLQGNATKWDHVKQGYPQWQFQFALNEMDIDKYMPLFALFAEQGDSSPAKSSKVETMRIKVGEGQYADVQVAPAISKEDYYRELVLHGDVKIDRLKIHNITAGKIGLAVHSEKGIYKVAPITALLYEGQYQGNLEADYNNKTWRYEQSLDSVNVHDLLHDAADLSDLRGTAKFASVLTGTSFDFKDAKAHMNGHAQFKVTDGAYTGFDVAYQWSQARQFMGQPVADRQDTKETPIKNLSASFVITDGIAKNDDLALYNDSIYAHGNGELNFKNDTMTFVVTTSEAITSQDANGNTQYQPKDSGLPIHLTGPITKPSLSIDLNTLKNIVIQKTGGQIINKILDKAEDGAKDTGEAVKNLFKGLLGQ